jgi:DNA repair photolyase
MVECKRALSPSGLPGIDYALNPYGGCEHGCIYCYAPEVLHTEWRDWRVVKVRSNIVERLSSELTGLSGVIGIGTVTDPYQAAEGRFMLTKLCLEELKRRGYKIHMHTKSDLILRDLNILKEMDCEIGITVTGIDDRWSKITEPGAPLPERRFDALKILTDNGVNTYALVGPILGHLEGNEHALVEKILSTGVKNVVLDSLNPRPQLSERLTKMNIKGSDDAKGKMKYLMKNAGLNVKNAF